MRLNARWNALALVVGAWGFTLSYAAAQPLLAAAVQAPALMNLRVYSHPAVPELQCAGVSRGAPSASAPDMDPREMPDDDEVQAALKEASESGAASPAVAQRNAGILGHARPGEPYRVAIWGDSHLAAGFFTQELVKLLKLAPEQVRAGLIPASMNRPGVRLPLRKTCVSSQWRYESAHANAASAATPGPGLVSLFSAQAGASVAWDLRNAAGEPEVRQLRVLYQQTANPVHLGVTVDGDLEVEVLLSGPPGPAMLELAGDGPLSVVQLRLISGEVRLQGLSLPVFKQTALQMDVFGFPGATAAGWKQASIDYLSTWFTQTPYDLVMMEFGTNEGNAKPFDALAYQATLRESVQRMRAVFPTAACVLIAPGDRGVLVRRSEKWKRLPVTAHSVSDKKSSKKTSKNSGQKSGKSASQSKSKTPVHHSDLRTATHEAKSTKSKAGQRKRSAASLIETAQVSAPVVEQVAAPESGPGPARNLLQYTRIHEEIGQIQNAVAQQQGCTVWSMLQAMGGQGSAYRWARQNPPLMARDLIHFTVPGYQQLAREFADDMGWNAAQLLSLTPP
jgi:hypothetical protein